MRVRPFRFGLSLGICIAVLSAAAQASDNRIDLVRPDAPELAAYGKLPIGVRTLQLVNPRQLDIVKAKAGEAIPVYDRPLTVEVWYPSLQPAELPARLANGLAPGEYRTVTRDPKSSVVIRGKALRDAAPDAKGGPYPLVIISHGYPGNRYLLSPAGPRTWPAKAMSLPPSTTPTAPTATRRCLPARCTTDRSTSCSCSMRNGPAERWPGE